MEFLDGLEIPLDLVQQLEQREGPNEEYLKNQAPWLQLPDENEKDYSAFLSYLRLSNDKWSVEDAHKMLKKDTKSAKDRHTLTACKILYTKNFWHVRRLSYVRYVDWKRKREEEAYHLSQLDKYRNNQSRLTVEASEAAVDLLMKTRLRIATLSPDEIGVKDIPAFLKSVVDILKVSFDSEAQALALNDLLQLFQQDMENSLTYELSDPLEFDETSIEDLDVDPFEVWQKAIESHVKE